MLRFDRHNSLRPPAPQNDDTIAREARTVGEIAESAHDVAERLKREVEALISKGRQVADDLERDGLALIELTQRQQAEFNQRCTKFFESTSDLHHGLRDILKRMGKVHADATDKTEKENEPTEQTTTG